MIKKKNHRGEALARWRAAHKEELAEMNRKKLAAYKATVTHKEKVEQGKRAWATRVRRGTDRVQFTEEGRKRISEGVKRYFREHPELKRTMSAKRKQWWIEAKKDPVYYEKLCKRLRDLWYNMPKEWQESRREELREAGYARKGQSRPASRLAMYKQIQADPFAWEQRLRKMAVNARKWNEENDIGEMVHQVRQGKIRTGKQINANISDHIKLPYQKQGYYDEIEDFFAEIY